ncbi:MAG: WYL domain-containing protein [Microbacterium sp.]|uniref:helix-turn-helix transcriptional regulator n=1 Tax=Microbacterium sp. TaxID=51671 RepID=UPI0039E60604
MPELSAARRSLRLLELLHARRFWPGAELAGRLGVTARTLRRDIDALRELGYRIDARPGRDGGYGIAVGSELPPLVFDAGEAVATAAALAVAVDGPVGGVALTALAKLETVMPAALRSRVRAIRSSVALGAVPVSDPVDPEVLAVLALAARDGERVRFRHRPAPRPGDDSPVDATRRADPVALVPRGGRWYLVAWDLDRADWRTFRVDRISRAEPTRVAAGTHHIPGGDAAAFLAEQLDALVRQVTATVRISAPLAEVTGLLGDYAGGFAADPVDPDATLWRIADARWQVLAGALVWLPWPFEVLDAPELAEMLGQLAERFAAAAAHSPTLADGESLVCGTIGEPQ